MMQVICFGIIINYCKRLDLALSTNFYRYLSYLITALCVLVELIVNLA